MHVQLRLVIAWLSCIRLYPRRTATMVESEEISEVPKYLSVFSTVKNVELANLLSSECPQKFIDTHCGNGWNFYGSENLAQEGSLRIGARNAETVVGLDINRKYLLRARVNTQDFSNIHLIRADANFPPLHEDFIKGCFMNIDPSNIREMITLEKLKYYCLLADKVTLTLPKTEWGIGSRAIKAKSFLKKGFSAKGDKDLLLKLRAEILKIGKHIKKIRGETRDHFRILIEGKK